MKRLLLPLLAALALPTAVNTEEFIELRPINPHSYLKSSLVKWEENNRRYISFKGTTDIPDCFGRSGAGSTNYACGRNPEAGYGTVNPQTVLINKDGWKTVLIKYDVDCIEKKYDRKGDVQIWHGLIVDQTPFLVAQKYCPIEEWSKLPNK